MSKRFHFDVTSTTSFTADPMSEGGGLDEARLAVHEAFVGMLMHHLHAETIDITHLDVKVRAFETYEAEVVE